MIAQHDEIQVEDYHTSLAINLIELEFRQFLKSTIIA